MNCVNKINVPSILLLITMLNTNNWQPRKFWDNWMDHLQNPLSKNVKYYKDFCGTIEIYHYDDSVTTPTPSNAQYSVKLYEAWPEWIGPYALGWENSEMGNFEISMRYKWWEASK